MNTLDNLYTILQNEIKILTKFKTSAMNRKLFRTALKFTYYIDAYKEVINHFIPQAEKEK